MSSPARDAQTPAGHSGGTGSASAPPATGPRPHRPMGTVGLMALLVCAIVGAAAGITAWLTHGFRGQDTVRYHRLQRAGRRLRQPDAERDAGDGRPLCGQSRCRGVGLVPPRGHSVARDGGGPAAGRVGLRLTGYLNPQLAATNLAQAYVYPGRQAWDFGERTVVCEVRATSGKLTGSVRSGG